MVLVELILSPANWPQPRHRCGRLGRERVVLEPGTGCGCGINKKWQQRGEVLNFGGATYCWASTRWVVPAGSMLHNKVDVLLVISTNWVSLISVLGTKKMIRNTIGAIIKFCIWLGRSNLQEKSMLWDTLMNFPNIVNHCFFFVCFSIPIRKIVICLYFPTIVYCALFSHVWRCFIILQYPVQPSSFTKRTQATNQQTNQKIHSCALSYLRVGIWKNFLPQLAKVSVGSDQNESASVQGHHWSAFGSLSCLLAKNALWSPHR